MIDCLDASLHHMGSSLAKLNGLDAPLHRLNDCIQKSKDKQVSMLVLCHRYLADLA